MSALAWASKEGYEDVVVKLIEKGAFLNVPDNVSRISCILGRKK